MNSKIWFFIKQVLLNISVGLFLSVHAAESLITLRNASVLVAAGQFKQAVAVLKEYDPQNSEEEQRVNILTGNIYLALEKPAKALDFFEMADSQSIDNYEAIMGIAQSNLKLGKFKLAERFVQKAKKINADTVEPDFISALIGLRNGSPGQTGERLVELLKLRPASEDALIANAKYIALSGDIEAARKKVDSFLNKYPNSPDVQDYLAELQYKSGNKAEAARLKTIAAELYDKQGNEFKRDTVRAWLDVSSFAPLPQVPKPISPPLQAPLETESAPLPSTPELVAEAPKPIQEVTKPGPETSKPIPVAPKPVQQAKEEAAANSEVVRPAKISRKETKPMVVSPVENEFAPPVERFPFPANVSITGGSGFIIDSGKKVVTNKHVIEDGKEFAIRTGLGEVIKARVLFISPSDDIAILELDRPLPADRAIPIAAYSKPRVGRNVVVMGYPLWYMLGEGSPSLTNGMVSKRTGLQDDRGTFQLTAKVNKGNSGGPVFDLFGNVVGITVGKLDNKKIQIEEGFIPEDVNFAIHVDRLPSVANIQISTTESVGPELSTEELYQVMLGRVVMVATYK